MLVKKYNHLVALLVMFIVFSLLFGHVRVSAISDANNSLPNSVDFGANSSVYLMVSKRRPNNQLEVKQVTAVVEFTQPTGNVVTFIHGGTCGGRPDAGSPRTIFYVHRTKHSEIRGYGSDEIDTPANSVTVTSCMNEGSVSVNVPTLAPSTVPGREGKYVALVRIKHDDTTANNAFKITTNRSNAKIGFKGGEESSFGVQDRESADRSLSNFSFGFAPPCDSGTRTATLRWTDADWGSNQTAALSPNFSMRVVEYPAAGGVGTVLFTVAGSNLGGNNDVPQSYNFTVRDGYKYSWDWIDVIKTNGVQFNVPFDSTSFSQTCAPPVTPVGPTCTASNVTAWAGASFTSRVTVTNPNTSALTINNVSYSGAGSGSQGGGSIAAGGNRSYDSNNISISSSGNHTVNWTVTSPNGNATCSSNVTINALPSCTASPATGWVNRPITITSNLNNSASATLVVNSVNYEIGSKTGSVTPNNVSGNNNRNYSTSQTFNDQGAFAIRWTFNTSAGTITCTNDGNAGNGDDEVIVYPTPTCTADSIVAWVGLPFTIRSHINNSAAINLSVSSSEYRLGSVTGSAGSENVLANSFREYTSGNITINSADNYNITWTFNTDAGTITCDNVGDGRGNPGGETSTADIYIPPTCTANVLFVSFRAGDPRGDMSSYILRTYEMGSVTVDILSAELTVDDALNTATGVIRTGLAGNTNTELGQNQNIRVMTPGNKALVWEIVVRAASATEAVPIGIACSSIVPITVEPITCTVNTFTIEKDVEFSVNVTLNNPNLIPIPVTSTNWSLPSSAAANPSSGSGGTGNIGAGLDSTFESAAIVASNTGNFSIVWAVNTAYGGSSPFTSNPNAVACADAGNDALVVRTYPYVRFYGNDVIAGGGYGDQCISNSVAAATARGVGSSHIEYKGSASELAVFAAGAISGILPGSQDGSRSPVQELSFANDGTQPVNTSSQLFGGGYSPITCAPTFPDPTGWQTIPNQYWQNGMPGSTFLRLDGLPTGKYVVANNTHILESTVSKGARITIYAIGNNAGRDGDVTFLGNVSYEGYDTGWANVGEIPLLRIYAKNDVRIDHSVTEVAGVFSAKNTIRTCSDASTAIGFFPVNSNTYNQEPYVSWPFAVGSSALSIAEMCSDKLTINGAFISKNVQLLRTNGSMSLSSLQEGPEAEHAGEVFRFSPEMYLAMLDEGVINVDRDLDSVVSLPPAF